MSLLSHKHLQDEQAAYNWVEAHVWPEGPVCPHCGSVERIAKMAGKATRFGLYKCYACRKQFRVTVGTIFEKSHVPLHIWLQAFFLLARKQGHRSNQLHRTLGVTLRLRQFAATVRGHAPGLAPPMGGNPSRTVRSWDLHRRKEKPAKGAVAASTTRTPCHLLCTTGEARSVHIDKLDAFAIVRLCARTWPPDRHRHRWRRHYSERLTCITMAPSTHSTKWKRDDDNPGRGLFLGVQARRRASIGLLRSCIATLRRSTSATAIASSWA
jgi:transposase-like protein